MIKNIDYNIKPCPFCGGEAYIRINFGKPFVDCFHAKKCHVCPSTFLGSSDTPIEKQIKYWNSRIKEEK